MNSRNVEGINSDQHKLVCILLAPPMGSLTVSLRFFIAMEESFSLRIASTMW